MTPSPEFIHSIIVVTAIRYLTVVGCVLLLWDHLLTLKDEIKHIWRLPVEFTTFIFLFNRYVVAGILCWSVYIILELRGPLTQEMYVERCRTYVLTMSSTLLVAITIADLTIIFRLQALWGEHTTAKYISAAVFIITYGVTLACGGLSVESIQSQVLWVHEINSCVLPVKPTALVGVWGGAATFDLFMLGMVCANAVNRPYRDNSEVVRNLRRDGIKFFLVLLFMRIVNLLIVIFTAPKELLIIAFLSWAIVSITLSRFLLMVKAVEEAAAEESRGFATSATGTTLWRNNSGYWSREREFTGLRSIPRSIR